MLNKWVDDLTEAVEDMEFDRKYTIPIQRLPRLKPTYDVYEQEKNKNNLNQLRWTLAICNFWLDRLMPLFAKLNKRNCTEFLLLKNFDKEDLIRIRSIGYIESYGPKEKLCYKITEKGASRYEELKKDAKSIRDFRRRAKVAQS